MEDPRERLTQADFNQLFLAERVPVYRHLRYLTGDRELAEDLTQETFSRLYELGPGQSGALRRPRAWLLRVASNLAYNHFRGEKRRVAREEAVRERAPEGGEDVTRSGPDVEDVLDVRRALAELEPRDRAALLLRHSGFSYLEIAEALEIAKSSVGTTLARAQQRFRIAYESGDEKKAKDAGLEAGPAPTGQGEPIGSGPTMQQGEPAGSSPTKE
jgi:RNA polymerase sigma factor (sigma-70 family)